MRCPNPKTVWKLNTRAWRNLPQPGPLTRTAFPPLTYRPCMDSESVSTIRDAFLFDVHRQFEGLARWVAAPLIAEVWEDGREAVFTVSRDDYELICFTVSFDVGGDEGQPDLRARLVIEQGEDVQEALVLRWRKNLPEPRKGLDSRADEAAGDYAPAMGSVVHVLRERLGDALVGQAPPAPRLPALRAPSEPVRFVETKPERTVEPVRLSEAATKSRPFKNQPAHRNRTSA